MKLLNLTLKSAAQDDFYKALKNPSLGLIGKIDDFAMPLYYEEMKIDRSESQVETKHK